MKKLLRSKKGAGVVEYALITALLAVAIITAIGALSGNLKLKFGAISTNVGSTAPTN